MIGYRHFDPVTGCGNMALSKGVCLFICSITIFAISAVESDDDFKGFSVLSLEHSFGTGKDAVFTPRGTVMIHSLKSGEAQFSNDEAFTPEEKEKLKDLVKANDVYRIRVVPKNLPPNTEPTIFASSFIKACLLYESKLQFVISINVDPSGNVLGISLKPLIPFCTGQMVSDHQLSRFKTSVEVTQTTAGPQPETQAYISKLEEEKVEKAKGQREDNRSFLGKYWYYIVPLVLIFMFLSGDPNAPGGGGGGGSGR